jgi:polyhydroxyalkanoate synthesis regulator phasin
VREQMLRGVVLTGERLQEAMDDAVRRGRLTRDDAEELVQNLLSAGRKQTEDLLAELEQLLGRGQKGATEAARQARQVAGEAGQRARARATSPTDRVLREVDRARRVAGIGTFPILGYDGLAVGQVTTRLADLSPPELRKVRDYERRNANRKSVLGAIEKRLGS